MTYDGEFHDPSTKTITEVYSSESEAIIRWRLIAEKKCFIILHEL